MFDFLIGEVGIQNLLLLLFPIRNSLDSFQRTDQRNLKRDNRTICRKMIFPRITMVEIICYIIFFLKGLMSDASHSTISNLLTTHTAGVFVVVSLSLTSCLVIR